MAHPGYTAQCPAWQGGVSQTGTHLLHHRGRCREGHVSAEDVRAYTEWQACARPATLCIAASQQGFQGFARRGER